MPDLSTDVLVIGAGPTGLMLANWLTRLGVGTVIADHKSGPTRESRALILQARSMEIYDQLGLGNEVQARGEPVEWLAPGTGKRAFGRIAIGELGRGMTPFPRLFVLEQSRNEQILNAHLESLGGAVRWNHRLTALADGPGGGITATLDGPDGEVTVAARFCVGADGSSSAVRTLRSIPFEGLTNDHLFYVADAIGVTGVVPGAVNVRPGAHEFLLTFPMGPDGHHRVISIARDTDGDGTISEDDARERLREAFGVSYASATWFSTYRVHHRVAAKFRDGPVFLAGDAGHVHSPVGAQGMNTGLQDAHNLAFKLADVVQGRARDEWLDRYEAERRPVALRLVSTTDRIFAAVTSEREFAKAVRGGVIPLAGPVLVRTIPRLQGASRLFAYLSQIRVHYWMPGSPTGGRRGRVVGRRLPWTGGNYDVLGELTWQVHTYGDAGRPAAGRIGRELGLPVHVFPAAPERTLLREGLFYLVRPDGFVAAAATSPAAVEAFRRAQPAAAQPAAAPAEPALQPDGT
jgi:2-polyprenyl-6-methoxyphenol hydroxylase-like FAD-dependent oxidoreductase